MKDYKSRYIVLIVLVILLVYQGYWLYSLYNKRKLNRASCGPRGHMKPGVVLSAFNIMGILPCFDRLYS